MRSLEGDIVGLACLIDRSGGQVDVGAPMVALATLDVQAWPESDLPEHLQNIPVVKPGSRGVSQ